jgi:hypothetical protein
VAISKASSMASSFQEERINVPVGIDLVPDIFETPCKNIILVFDSI